MKERVVAVPQQGEVARLDDYILGATLGKGASAKVVEATDPEGIEWAIKIFKLDNPAFNV